MIRSVIYWILAGLLLLLGIAGVVEMRRNQSGVSAMHDRRQALEAIAAGLIAIRGEHGSWPSNLGSLHLASLDQPAKIAADMRTLITNAVYSPTGVEFDTGKRIILADFDLPQSFNQDCYVIDEQGMVRLLTGERVKALRSAFLISGLGKQ